MSPAVSGVPVPAGTLQSYNVNYLLAMGAPVDRRVHNAETSSGDLLR